MTTATKKKPVSTVKLASPRKWDGASLYKECKEQGIYPSFESGNFVGYIDRQTNKKVTTTLPSLSSIAYDGYLKAERAAVEAAKSKKGVIISRTEVVQKMLKVKKVKAPKPAKTPSPGRLDVTKAIHLKVKDNPRREGTAVAKSFDLYKEGMKVTEYLALSGSGRNHLLWDMACGYVELK
jgi:hypothetical protein